MITSLKDVPSTVLCQLLLEEKLMKMKMLGTMVLCQEISREMRASINVSGNPSEAGLHKKD